MQDFIHPDWSEILLHNQLASFDALMSKESLDVDEPNLRQSGWSRVSKISLLLQNGEKQSVFLKRQCNYVSRPLAHPIKGVPTFRREIDNIRRFEKQNIKTLTPLFYGERTNSQGRYAILMTLELDGYTSLEAFLKNVQNKENWPMVHRKESIAKIAKHIRQIHDNQFRYGCLYAKHVFVCADENDAISDVCLIDLEKVRRWYLPFNRMIRDLSALYRSLDRVSNKDAVCFAKHYFGHDKLTVKDKKIIRKLQKNIRRKNHE